MVLALILAAGILPLAAQYWIRGILRHFDTPRATLPGTGGELVLHLLDHHSLHGITLATTETENRFDPKRQEVLLSDTVHQGRSLTAIVTSTRIVGQAIQCRIGYRPYVWQYHMESVRHGAQYLGAALFVATPFIASLTNIQAVGLIILMVAGILLCIPIAIAVLTFPVEWDASFKRALPVLKLGYLGDDELICARNILTALAVTPLVFALATPVNFRQLIRILRQDLRV